MVAQTDTLNLRRSTLVGGWIAAANRIVMAMVGACAATLVMAEVVVLLVGVVYRYVLHAPIAWSDELASTLFIWLSMLGAVLALGRSEHMRLTVFVNRLPLAWQTWIEAVASLIVSLLVLMLLPSALEHASEQMFITTPALSMPDGWRAAALPAGAVLMLFCALSRLIAETSALRAASALAFVGAIAGLLFLMQPWLQDIGNYNLLIFFVLIVGVCTMAGIPIAFSFGVATAAYLSLVTDTPLTIVVSRMDEGMSTLILLSVPMFVLLGALLELSGMARALIAFMASLIGHVRGGLQYILLGAMFLVSGISGSKAADMAAIAPALFPEMKKRGVVQEDLVALLAASGAMTETIPPSLVLITIGAVCGVSISALFVGGLMPAVIASITVAAICGYKARREAMPLVKRASWRTIATLLAGALPALALPVLIRVSVIEGIATATEVAAIGVAYTVLVGLCAHLFVARIDLSRLYPMLVDSATLTGAILLIIGMATAMAWALTQSGFSADLVAAIVQVPGGKFGFLLISIVTFVLLGALLEGIPAIVLFGPMLFPAARALGVHDVHYAMVMILAMGIGLFAPPLGVGFYSACAVGKTSPDDVMHRVWPYLGALLVALLIIAAVPWLSIGFLD